MKSKELNILVLEDDPVEALKLKRILTSLSFKYSVVIVENGEEALDTLFQESQLPDIILCDLNMPKMNGMEFLKNVQSDKALKSIPIVMLTVSDNQEEMKACYAYGIAGYLSKPLNYEEYFNKIEKLLSYWNINEGPLE